MQDRTTTRRGTALLSGLLAAAMVAGCSGGGGSDGASSGTSLSIPSELSLPEGLGSAGRPIDSPPLPLSALALFARFGNDRLTGATQSADGSLRFEAPPESAEAGVSAEEALDAVPDGLISSEDAAATVLGVWADGDRPLVWIVLQAGAQQPPSGTAVPGETADDRARREAAVTGPVDVVALVDATTGTYLGTYYPPASA